MKDWVNAINRDQVDIADILGGEPLLLPWLVDMIRLCPNTRFGISTNGIMTSAALVLASARLSNIISINVSMHPESEERWPMYLDLWSTSLEALRSVYAVHVNLVDAPDNRRKTSLVAEWCRMRGIEFVISPYETVHDLGETTDLGLCCRGGHDHLLVTPDGSAYPCFTALRSPFHEQYLLGNWLDDTMEPSRKPEPCYLKCVDYYVLPSQHQSGDLWGVQVRPCESS